jgi:putative PEP-CTERM system TPR-repeat lipoprotein
MMTHRTSLLITLVAIVPTVLPISGCARDEPAAVIARASQQIDAGDYRRASVELRNVIQQAPENTPEHYRARALLGRATLALGDPSGAEQQLNRARELGATPADYAVPLAQALTAMGRPAEAREALALLPEAARGVDWSVAQAEALATEGQLVEARQVLERVLRTAPDTYRALTVLARVLAVGGDLADARAMIERAIKAGPDQAEGYLLRARLDLQVGQLGTALADLEQAVEIESRSPVSPQEVEALALLAQVQLGLNRADELAQTRDRLRRRAPDLPLTAFVEGAVHYLDQNHRDAILKLQESLSGVPDNEQALVLLGASYLATDNLAQAEQALRRVSVGLQSANPAATRLLAETRRRQGRPDLALSLLRGLPNAEQDPQILGLLGVISVEAGLPVEGVSLLERAAAAAPGQPAIQLQLARAYLAADRRADALAMFDGPFGSDAEEAVLAAIELLGAQGMDGNVDAARGRIEALLTERPADAQLAMAAALFYQAIGDDPAARAAIERAISLDRGFVSAYLTRGALLLASEDREAARSSFREATERAPDNYRGWLGLAQLAALDGAQDEALRLTREAVAADPRELPPLLALAQLELRAQNVAAVREITAAARQLDANSPDVATLLGLLAVQEQDLDRAILEFQRAVDAQPRRADRWQNLAQAQIAAGRLQQARNSLSLAVERVPEVPGLRFALSQAEAQLGNLDGALELGRGLVKDFPQLAEGYLAQASIETARGNYAAAALLFDEAYGRNPSFEAASAAYQARRLAGLPDGDRLVRRWLQQNPGDTRALLILGEILAEVDEAAALLQFERAIALDGNNVVALNNAAWALRESDRPRAVAYAERARQLAPDTAPVLDTLGWVLVLDGQVEAGLPHLRRAAELDPRSGDIRYHLAFALAESGDAAGARRIVDELLAGEAPFSYRDEAQQLRARL